MAKKARTKPAAPAPIAPILSFRGRRWTEREADRDVVRSLLESGQSPVMARLMAARGFNATTASEFLDTSILDHLPAPGFFNDMNKAVERILEAVKWQQKVAIWGDYDVDGATSTAILTRTLRLGGVEPEIYIPDRVTEGYGPNTPGLTALKLAGFDLVCVLDSGTTAFEPLAAAAEMNLDVVVIDHHAAVEELPKAIAVVNPNRLDQEPGYGHVCAAGMTWIACRELAMRMPGKPLADVVNLLDIVALGTVCDVVPLTGINRAFVREGLEIMSKRQNPGIASLAHCAGIEQHMFESFHCGFGLGPRINAGGRVGEAKTGALLLTCDDRQECDRLAALLNDWNRERQEIEKACLEEAMAEAETQYDSPITFVIADGWHEGVIGIVAGRLKEAFDKPTFVFSIVHPGEAKGSGRSMPGFDLGAAVIAARENGILTKGGGHAMAAGATIPVENAAAFRRYLEDQVRQSEFAKAGSVTDIDASISVLQVTLALTEAIEEMQPFGQGNPKPRFKMANCRAMGHRLLKDKHLKLELQCPGQKRPLPALLFNAVGSPLGDQLIANLDGPLDLVVTLSVNEWKGSRTVQAFIEDARIAA